MGSVTGAGTSKLHAKAKQTPNSGKRDIVFFIVGNM